MTAPNKSLLKCWWAVWHYLPSFLLQNISYSRIFYLRITWFFTTCSTPLAPADFHIATRLLPVYDIFLLGNWPKTSSFWLLYQEHSSFANCAGELFKPSKDPASLLVCNEKRFFVFLW